MITEHHIMTYNEGNKMSESWKESIGLWSFMESTRHSTLFKKILLRLAVWTFTESTSAAQRTLLGRQWLSLRSLESLRQLTSSHPRWTIDLIFLLLKQMIHCHHFPSTQLPDGLRVGELHVGVGGHQQHQGHQVQGGVEDRRQGQPVAERNCRGEETPKSQF